MRDDQHLHVFLADDDLDTLSALRLLLSQQNGVRVVGQAVQREELVTKVTETNPDVLLFEWEFSGKGNAELFAQLRADCQMRIVVISSRSEEEAMALNAGADVFISKGDAPNHLLAELSRLRPHNICTEQRNGIFTNAAN